MYLGRYFTMLQSTTFVFLLFVLTTTIAHHEYKTYPPPECYMDILVTPDNGSNRCSCTVLTRDWHELSEYRMLDYVTEKLNAVQSLLELLHFTTIFDQLEDTTARLNDLEADSNKQSINASMTELYALRQNVDSIWGSVERANRSSFIAREMEYLEHEMMIINRVIDEIWEYNPYRRWNEDKKTVAELREHSRCHKDLEVSFDKDVELSLSPFEGDILAFDSSLHEGWCSSDGKLFKLGLPMTHKWGGFEHRTRLWYKDPQPLTTASRTQLWNIIYSDNTTSTFDYMSLATPVLINGFSTYGDFIMDQRSVTFDSNIQGHGPVIFRNALYYSAASDLVKQDLTTLVNRTAAIGFEHVKYNGSIVPTFLDLNVDESGLWVVHSISSDKKIAISKLDPDSLIVERTWMTGIVKSDVCAAFMLCGKLYTVASCGSRLAPNDLNYVFDTRTSLGQFAPYFVPSLYGELTQLTYNPRERTLFAMDKGHMVTYIVEWEK